MYVHAQALGEPPLLTQAQMDQVMEQMRRMSYGQAPDLDEVADAARPRGGARTRRATKP
jgi:L-fuculose-phosphate aldolase